MRNMLFAVLGLIVIAVAVMYGPSILQNLSGKTGDPVLDKKLALVREMTVLMETACLSSGSETLSSTLTSEISAIKSVKASASAETKKKILRGAAALPEKLGREDDKAVRDCMAPYARKIADAALKGS